MKVHSMKSSDVFYFYNSSVGDLTQYIYKYSKIPGGGYFAYQGMRYELFRCENPEEILSDDFGKKG